MKSSTLLKLFSILFLFFGQKSKAQLTIISDAKWKVSSSLVSGWEYLGFNDASWVNSTSPATDPGITPSISGSKSMWWKNTNVYNAYFRKSFFIPDQFANGTVEIAADNEFIIFVNGIKVGGGKDHKKIYNFGINNYLKCGENVIAIHGIEYVLTTPSVMYFKAVIDTSGNGGIPKLGNDTLLCQGKKLTLDAKIAGAKYLWSNSQTTRTIQINKPGKYWVTVGSSGCSESDTINITYNNLPKPKLGKDTSFCEGGSYNLDGSTIKAISYNWNTGNKSSIQKTTTTGTYILNITDNVCIQSDTVKVMVIPFPKMNLGKDTSFCGDFNFRLDAGNSGLSKLWNTSETSQTIIADFAGLYWVEVDRLGCKSRDSILIKELPGPKAYFGNDTAYCEAFSRILRAENPEYNYLWSNGSTSSDIIINTPGKYWIRIYDTNACISTDTIELRDSSFSLSLGNDTTLCSGEKVNITAKDINYQHLWNTGEKSEMISVSKSGIYSVTVSNGTCIRRDTVLITVRPKISLNLDPEYYLCETLNETFTLSVPTGYKSYKWHPGGETTTSLVVTKIGIYSVQVQDNYSCIDSDTTAIIKLCPYALWVPTAFSPGSGSDNALFGAVYEGPPIENFEMRIFSRWGELFYISTSLTDKWDGIYMGSPCQIGFYHCSINMVSLLNNERKRSVYNGMVYLNR